MTENMAETPTEEDDLKLAAARARARLVEAPEIIGWVRAQIIPGIGGAQDGMPRPASKDAPLPLRADALDDSDDAFERILYWVAYWAGIFNEQAPALMVTYWRVQGETRGFSSGTTPEGATALVRTVTTYLLTRQNRIMGHPTARAYLDDIATTIWDLRSKYPTAPRAPRGVLDRPCPICGEYAFGADWPNNADVRDFVLSCSHCLFAGSSAQFIREGRIRELLQELREEHADPKSEWWTKRQAIMELSITARTLNNYIRDGLPTYTVGGVVHVKVEELFDMFRRKRQRMLNQVVSTSA